MTAETSASDAQDSQGLSKRALKRLSKQQQSQEQSPAATEATTSSASSVNGEETGNDPVLELIQKRIRNLQKRKQRLDKYAELQKTVEGSKSLNQDQLNALANKEAVEAPLKELSELLDVHKAQVKRQQQEEKAKDKKWEKKLAEEREKSKLEGLGVGQEKLDLAVKLLRAISYKRVVSTTTQEETLALEHLLQCIYAGDESSLEAIDKVWNEADEAVVEGSVTYKKVKAIALTPPDKLMGTQEEVHEVDEDSPEEATQQTNSVVQKISFLQVEENDDEDAEPQSESQTQSQHQGQTQPQQSQSKDGQQKKNNYRKRKPRFNKKKDDQQPKANGSA